MNRYFATVYERGALPRNIDATEMMRIALEDTHDVDEAMQMVEMHIEDRTGHQAEVFPEEDGWPFP